MTTLVMPPSLLPGSDSFDRVWNLPEPAGMGWPPGVNGQLESLARRVENEALIPLLQSENLEAAILECFLVYEGLAQSFGEVLMQQLGLEDSLNLSVEAEKSLGNFFSQYAAPGLSEKAAQSLAYGLDIRRIVRESVKKYAADWDDEEIQAVARHVTAHDFCTIAVAYHLACGAGLAANAQRLASWSYWYADYAAMEFALTDSKYHPGIPLKRPAGRS